MGQTFFDASAGDSALEPIQLAVRSVIERATLEMMSRLYQVPQSAAAVTADPLAGADDGNRAARPATQHTTAMNEEKYNETSRQDPYHGYGDSDAAGNSGLRGGLN
jgi:hypothetical protein